jgi:glucosamine-6-phosphate isomerase
LARDHPESYHSFMWTNFFRHIDINPAHVHILDGNTADLQKECADFERAIKDSGGIQLFVGGEWQCVGPLRFSTGIGPDGHIAFNEPGSSLVSRTRLKTLARETITANARFFGNDVLKVPTMALTVGVGTVMDAKEVNTVSAARRTRAHTGHDTDHGCEQGARTSQGGRRRRVTHVDSVGVPDASVGNVRVRRGRVRGAARQNASIL